MRAAAARIRHARACYAQRHFELAPLPPIDAPSFRRHAAA